MTDLPAEAITALCARWRTEAHQWRKHATKAAQAGDNNMRLRREDRAEVLELCARALEAEADAIREQAAAAERERLAQQQPVCASPVPPNLICMTCFRPLCRSCGACACPENAESLCDQPQPAGAEEQP